MACIVGAPAATTDDPTAQLTFKACPSTVRPKGKRMYPTVQRSERIADGYVHAIGVLGATIGAIVLLVHHAGLVSAGQLSALAIYGGALMATFVASALYHMAPWHAKRPMLRRVDHAAIYLKIAGTYTPLVVMIGTTFAYLILAIVWGLAAVGITLKLFFWRTPGRFGPALYLGMGWLSIFLIWSVWTVLPGQALALIAIGGLTYTVGVLFYKSTAPYTTAVWHGFVAVASACFWTAIMIGAMASV